MVIRHSIKVISEQHGHAAGEMHSSSKMNHTLLINAINIIPSIHQHRQYYYRLVYLPVKITGSNIVVFCMLTLYFR